MEDPAPVEKETLEKDTLSDFTVKREITESNSTVEDEDCGIN